MSTALRKRLCIPDAGFAIYADAGANAAAQADASAEATKLAKELAGAFEAFKAQHSAQIVELKRGRDDVVTREHTDRINATVGEMSKALEDVQKRIAALAAAGLPANDNGDTIERRAYTNAFRQFMRRGVEDGLRDLAIKATLTTDSNPDGGFVVAPATEGAMTRVLEVVSAMRRLATVQTISTPSFVKLHNLGSAGSGWVTEQGSRAETSTPQLARIEIPSGEIYAMPAATQTMLDDAVIPVETWLGAEVAAVFSEQESLAFVSGNGVNRPRGILGYTTVANASYAWGKIGFVKTGANGAFVTSSATANGYDAMLDLYHGLKQGYRAGAAFLMNDASLARIRKIKDAEGHYIYLPPTEGEPGRILGKAVEVDDNMPDFATGAFPVAFGDFKRGYMITDRQGVRVLRDPFSAKPYVLFYTTKRVGGGVTDFAAIKLLQSSA